MIHFLSKLVMQLFKVSAKHLGMGRRLMRIVLRMLLLMRMTLKQEGDSRNYHARKQLLKKRVENAHYSPQATHAKYGRDAVWMHQDEFHLHGLDPCGLSLEAYMVIVMTYIGRATHKDKGGIYLY